MEKLFWAIQKPKIPRGEIEINSSGYVQTTYGSPWDMVTKVHYLQFPFTSIQKRYHFTPEDLHYLGEIFGAHRDLSFSFHSGMIWKIKERVCIFNSTEYKLMKFKKVIVLSKTKLKSMESIKGAYWTIDELKKNLLGDLRCLSF